MSLNWDMANVTDRDEIAFTPVDADGNRQMMWWAETIIFATMPIGLGEITAKNAEEFWYRIDMYQKVAGGLASGPDGPAMIEPGHVRSLIGLRTNVFPASTLAQFAKRMREISQDRSRSAWTLGT